jgi:hypothetical protein
MVAALVGLAGGTIAEVVLDAAWAILPPVVFVAWTVVAIGLCRARGIPDPADPDPGRALGLPVAAILVTFLAASWADPYVGDAAWLVLIAVSAAVYSWCLYRAG